MDGIDSIIRRLEQQRAALEIAIASLRQVGGEISGTSRRRGRAKGARKRKISAEGRQRQIEAMRRYWAAKKAASKK